MRILITAGGTSEKIDRVREITNQSTGALGFQLATYFNDRNCQVDYVTTTQAIQLPKEMQQTIHYIHDTESLFSTLKSLTATYQYDAIIHSMAVSDFTPEMHFSQEDLLRVLNETFTSQPGPLTNETFTSILKQAQPKKSNKISSQTNRLFLTLTQTPKIIDYLKQWQPKALLVGFKLLVGVSQEELLTVAQKTMIRSGSDYIFANDLNTIHAKQHHGYLLNKNGIVGEAVTKAQIAELIGRTILYNKEMIK